MLLVCSGSILAVHANQLHPREARRNAAVQPHTAALENLEPADRLGISRRRS